MKISDDLKLVIPARSDDQGVLIYAYHTPISREVFEANYRLLAAVKSELAGKGIHYQMDSGPRIASLVLMDEAKKEAINQGKFNTDNTPNISEAKALLAEIKRLTMVLVPNETGWDLMPVDSAISKDRIDAEEWREVESGIVFFMCHYSLAKRSEKTAVFYATASLLEGLSTSLPALEFADSLKKSTTEEDSSEKAASSVPR